MYFPNGLGTSGSLLGKTSNSKSEALVDVASITVTGNIRLAWVKGVPAHHTEKGVKSDKGNG
jgi:hypothetical protein